MKKLSITLLITVAAFFASLALAPASFAQQEDAQEKMQADKTGTNPVNFQRDFRVYNEYTWLNVPGDGSQNVTTLEFRTPFAGGKVPDDRIIDGIEMRDFFLGKTDKSGREGVIVYFASDVYGVKWRNWKMNFKEIDTIFGEVKEYGMPKIYNLYKDPGERESVTFPHTWVAKAAMPQLIQHVMSLRQEPPIKPGTKDPYEPPK